MNINDLKDILLKENHTLVIYKNNASVITSNDRGVNSLIKLIKEDKSQLSGSLIADKVIGKAAALLMIYAGVKEIYAPIISKPALQTLLKHNVKVYYNKEVERIINRKGDGLCPMETLCLDIEKPDEAYLLLSTK
ncbi:MAG: DUF1893 domain-containing protein [Bacteroidales bacterium]|nr:DUF1893 domain-containing protein [Bacteroidales bacterium]